MKNFSDFLWVEKYRPNRIENMILSNEHRTIFNEMIKNRRMNNLLFYGPKGSGKCLFGKEILSIIYNDTTLKISIENLFKNHTLRDNSLNEVVPLWGDFFIINDEIETVPILGIIRKNNIDIYKIKFSNGVEMFCPLEHKMKTARGSYEEVGNIFKKKELLRCVYSTPFIEEIELFSKNDFAYDIAVGGNYTYLTPNGFFNHNTSMGLILCSENGLVYHPEENVMIINGSEKDSRGISQMDKMVEDFFSYPPYGNDKMKIFFIDEADRVTQDAMGSLRHKIEKFQKSYGRFIFTCNYPRRIDEAIRSRFMQFEFTEMPLEKVGEYCEGVLEKEKIKYEKENLEKIIEEFYPDVRSIILSLDKYSISGVLEISKIKKSIEKEIIKNIFIFWDVAMKKGVFDNNIIEKLISFIKGNYIEFQDIYNMLFFNEKIPVILKVIINDYAFRDKSVLNEKMNFMGMVFDVGKKIKEMKNNGR